MLLLPSSLQHNGSMWYYLGPFNRKKYSLKEKRQKVNNSWEIYADTQPHPQGQHRTNPPTCDIIYPSFDWLLDAMYFSLFVKWRIIHCPNFLMLFIRNFVVNTDKHHQHKYILIALLLLSSPHTYLEARSA